MAQPVPFMTASNSLRAAGVFDRLLTEDHGIPIAVTSAAADRLVANTQDKGQKWLTNAQSGVAR